MCVFSLYFTAASVCDFHILFSFLGKQTTLEWVFCFCFLFVFFNCAPLLVCAASLPDSASSLPVCAAPLLQLPGCTAAAGRQLCTVSVATDRCRCGAAAGGMLEITEGRGQNGEIHLAVTSCDDLRLMTWPIRDRTSSRWAW